MKNLYACISTGAILIPATKPTKSLNRGHNLEVTSVPVGLLEVNAAVTSGTPILIPTLDEVSLPHPYLAESSAPRQTRHQTSCGGAHCNPGFSRQKLNSSEVRVSLLSLTKHSIKKFSPLLVTLCLWPTTKSNTRPPIYYSSMTHTAFYEIQSGRQLLLHSIHPGSGSSAGWPEAGRQVFMCCAYQT